MTSAELEIYADNTLGKETLLFLKKRNLEIFQTYEEHDFKHVLLDYDINLTQEITMQFFEFGNGNRSLPVCLILVAGPLIAPECFRHYLAAYRRGKRAGRISNETLRNELKENIYNLRKKYRI